jgi:SAM-dependent methyltransferase
MNILNWYKEQTKKYGAVKASRLFVSVYGSRLRSVLSDRLLTHRVNCPICGWSGRKFYDYIEGESVSRGVECPRCLSHGRHRSLYRWLENDFRLAEKSGRALVCAPEKPIDPLWKKATAVKCVRLDIEPSRGVDLLADLQEIPFAGDAFDIIWCHHVLEQVPDDKKALGEFLRVLRPETGTLIISSAMSGDEKTNEFGSSNVNHFGNWRIYGQDFPRKLSDAGFDVSEVEFDLGESEFDKYGIFRYEKIFLCRKTA